MKAKMKVNTLAKAYVPIYNEFVDTCNDHSLTFDKFEVREGESKDGIKGLSFEMQLPFGLEQEKASQIFKTFINNHPECGISFNTPEESALEKILTNKAQTVIKVDEGFKLERI